MSPPTNAEHDNGTETGTVPAVAAPMTPGANVTAEQSNDKASAPTLLADPSLVVAEKESMHGVVGIEQEQLQNEKEESKQEENDGRASLTQGTTMQEAAAAARQAFSFDSASGPLMESFVQQASSLKTLLSSTLKKRPHEKNSKKNDEPAPEPSPQRRRVVESEGLTAQLVRQKTAEMLTLQHKLSGMETEVATLKATGESLRTEATVNRQRYERTAEALRMAQHNASQARTDADAAETTAANLSQTLQSLQAVVRETKESMNRLKSAHDEIQQKSTSLQSDLWQKEVRIACMENEYNAIHKDYQKLEQAQKSWKEEKTQFQDLLDEKERKIGSYQRQFQERRTMDEAREQRFKLLEGDWRKAQANVSEATAAESMGAETLSQLQADLRSLQQKNKDMYQDLMQTQDKARQEQERHHEALKLAEKEGQQWHIQLESCQDQNERLRLEKIHLEKQVSKLQGQLAAKTTAGGSQGLVSPEAEKASGADAQLGSVGQTDETMTPSPENSENGVVFASFVPEGVCVICGDANKKGLMKRCQCSPNCPRRAHLSCSHRLRSQHFILHPSTSALDPTV